ncbi:MAG: DEDD exonuclease domain-containing protein [Acidimicrobiia bacterium]|nr:DEDD exonuclease domain-containing protein [Acidimicrobiia bacterium]
MLFPPPSIQQSLDGLGVPLAEATFCVLDLETTGGDPRACGITEIGAVKVRGGEVIGTFQTMVNPGCGIPPRITMVTGITEMMVTNAPTINAVLPTFLDFVGGAVIVGHNIRFDMSFISAAIRRWGGPMLGNQRLDTLSLARRLLTDEVPRFSLGELAKRLRLPHQPCHRALDDAWATVDLLHFLIERASAWGVMGLDDLIALPTVAGHPQWKKLSLTSNLPRKPGVYFFADAQNRVLYVGKATDLRARVRSYFSSERRRKVPQLLRETAAIDHVVCDNTLEAELLELRLIQQHAPRFNRRGRRPTKPHYVKLTTSEAFPRLSIVRSTTSTGVYLGPISNRRAADLVVEALHTVVRLRRCTTRIGRSGTPKRNGLCTAAQLGKAACPCTGELSVEEYAPVVDDARRMMTTHPHVALDLLRERMDDLAAQERFEDAALTRNRAGALAAAVDRSRRIEMVKQLGCVSLQFNSRVVRIDSSNLSIEESLLVGGWIDRHAHKTDVLVGSDALASPLPRLGSFAPRKAPTLTEQR